MRGLLTKSSSAGVEPVVACGVLRHANKNVCSFSFKLSVFSFLSPSLRVFTARSASLLDDG